MGSNANERGYHAIMHNHWDAFVIDLDGTFLDSQGRVSDVNIQALDEVRATEIEIIIATGRCFTECKHILNVINHSGVTITAGGSALNAQDGSTIDSSKMSTAIVAEVAEQVTQGCHRCLLLKDPNICGIPYVLVGDAPLHQASMWWFESLNIPFLEVDTIKDDPWPEDTLRAGAVANVETLKPLAQKLEFGLKNRAKIQHWSAVTCSEATGSAVHLLEVFAQSVDKWSMLEKYMICSGRRLNHQRVISIGDGLNDIELLKHSGRSIAMGNASDFVKSHANFVGDHHQDNGFAKAVRRWVL